MSRKLIRLPGVPTVWVDPTTVVAARVSFDSESHSVVVHTSEGFAFSVTSEDVNQLLNDIVKLVK
jgi:hypothetical protein